MQIKELFARVRAEVDEETSKKLEPVLREIEVGITNLNESLRDANTESKSRKIKLREIGKSLEDKEIEFDELKKVADNTELKSELDELRNFKSGVLKETRTSFLNSFENVKDHPSFAKASRFLTIPESDKEGNIDWDSVDDDSMSRNVAEMNKLNTLEYFDNSSVEKKVESAGNKSGNIKTDVFERIKKATSIDELRQLNDEMAGA